VTTYIAILPNGSILKTNSHRASLPLTHVVVRKEEWVSDPATDIARIDARNAEFYRLEQLIAANDGRLPPKYGKDENDPEMVADRARILARAKATIAKYPTEEAYVEAKGRLIRGQVRARIENGSYDGWHNCSWATSRQDAERIARKFKGSVIMNVSKAEQALPYRQKLGC
jgi:hypothetical protein